MGMSISLGIAIANGGALTSAPTETYWNGFDLTVEDIVASQWGFSSSGETLDPEGNPLEISVTDGVATVADILYEEDAPPPWSTRTLWLALVYPLTGSIGLTGYRYFTVPESTDLNVDVFTPVPILTQMSPTGADAFCPELIGTTTRAGVSEDVYRFDLANLSGANYPMSLRIALASPTAPVFGVRFWSGNPL